MRSWTDMPATMGLPTLLLQFVTLLCLVRVIRSSDGMDILTDERFYEPIQCYECISYSHMNNYCGDPFNNSHPNVTIAQCLGKCVKWVRSPKPGIYRYQRTCSEKLKILMTINLVCMEESRPSTGRICFCKKDGCNTSTSHTAKMFTIITTIALMKVL